MIPRLTHLQFAVLNVLRDFDPHTGLDIRGQLAIRGIHIEGPAFYQAMARIEKSGWADGNYRQGTSPSNNQTVTERVYTLTPKGLGDLDESISFYRV